MSQNIYLLSRRRSERIIDISYSHYLDPMAGERWKNDIAYAMTPFKFIAWPIGVWPLQHYNFYSLLRSALGTCGASVMVILPSIELCMGCTDAEQNVDSIMLICCGTLGVLKMIWFRIYANSLTVNYSSAMKDYLTIENVEERAIMRKHALIGRIVSCPMLCFSYFSCIMYGLIPLLGYDKRNQINVTNEDLILEYVIPSACTMKYLNTPASMYKVLCLIQVVAMILSTNAHIGFQFILAMKNNDIVMMTKSLIVQSVFLIQITVYSFIGNYLKSQMEEIRFSIYQSAWYDLPAKLMKNLVFIFMQTESPVILQAGNFITINLSTYMSILKTSFSYLSVLRVMMET
ncbi:uncharacterized protein [Polyergus mexicanus]|uniref:uncharacterized protein isoform X1 n=1 Tax=Polyergus mexicanus TaxID=615972 RepID=UPI0038B45231